MNYKFCFLTLAALPFLASCSEVVAFKAVTAGISAASHGYFTRPDVNLTEKNYAAADFIAGQMRDFVRADSVVLMTPLEERDHAGVTSPLGKAIPEGIGLRFNELGYNHVLLHQVSSEPAGYVMPKNSALAPDFVLQGTYVPGGDQVDVFLRLIEVKTGRIITRFDYALSRSREVRELSKTQARIYRVE